MKTTNNRDMWRHVLDMVEKEILPGIFIVPIAFLLIPIHSNKVLGTKAM